ncbi:MAG: FAD-dependent oxidoreductase [Oscillospiraceae bacterium]|nr:FAD-dependent oxidoreductase [Oscillospiraceae bacterium]
MPYVINQEFCSACHQCRVECPVHAITVRHAKYWIDPEKGISCGKCVKVCHNGCISNPEKPAPKAEPHDKIVKTCDVCVIGAGAAGMVAAAKCCDEGKTVIVLEKMHEVGGSAWYAAGFRVLWSKWHEAAGARDKRKKEYERFLRMVDGNVNPKLLWRMFEANAEFVDWMIDEHDLGSAYKLEKTPMGLGLEGTFEWERAGTRIDKMIGPGEGGWYMTTHLRDDLLRKGGEILYKTPAVKLLTDDEGKISGVLAKDEGGEVEIACKAVVVATGCFSRNRELMNRFQPMFYENEGKEPIHIFSGAGSNGDGILMCEELGADIDYVNRRVNMFGPMRHPYPCVSLNIALGNSGMQIGSQGNLFEGSMAMQEISPLTKDPKWFIWKIVDDNIAEGAIADAREQPEQSPGMNLKKFMENWREVMAEEEVAGAVVSAPTLEDLAEKIGVDKDEFLKNIADYNESTKHADPAPAGPPPMMMDDDEEDGGLPPMFGSPKPKKPIEKGPFYALKLKMFHENAVGGMTIDENAAVLKGGVPIPGLYAAGDTTRGIMVPGDVGVGYIEGVFTALTQAFNEGYIAGVSAAEYAE